ncbi:MAG: ABC transporter ATP-binding protein [Lachnospiraceae bacterium]|nr:ABC transporter ATP-binding protein [Lachnospiraceae bacterium]
MQAILELSDIDYYYHTLSGETQALSHVSFTVHPGEFVAIVGPSGCGKSTLLSLITRLLTPSAGKIFFQGHPLKEEDTLHMGYMLQKDHLLEWRTIRRNVLLGLEIQKKITPKNLAYADLLLSTYGLAAFADKHPSELSGGMRQRAALIRTLVLQPELLLLDEPFSALDYQTRLHVSNDIGTIIKQEHKTAILVTHDLSEAISLGDRVIILSNRPGRIRSIVPIHFSDALSPMEKRNAKEFNEYFNLIWKEFEQNG